MNIPALPSLDAKSLSAKIPPDMKTMSVTRRHNVVISHAVAANRVLESLPALPPSLVLDTLPIGGQSCAFLQTVLSFNDNFRYTPLPIPNLDFWQLDFGVLVRRQNSETATRENGRFIVQSLLGTQAAWVLNRALAGERDFANFNVILRAAPNDDYATLIADIHPTQPEMPPTQIAVRSQNRTTLQAPFVNREKMSDFLLRRAWTFGALSLGDKFVASKSEGESASFVAAEIAPVGGEIGEMRLGMWEKLGLLDATQTRAPYDISILPETKIVLQTPMFL